MSYTGSTRRTCSNWLWLVTPVCVARRLSPSLALLLFSFCSALHVSSLSPRLGCKFAVCYVNFGVDSRLYNYYIVSMCDAVSSGALGLRERYRYLPPVLGYIKTGIHRKDSQCCFCCFLASSCP